MTADAPPAHLYEHHLWKEAVVAPARFLDPTGERYGLPTYPYGWAPEGLLTKNQLKKKGLRPGGHDPVAQLMWASTAGGSRGGVRTALLYDLALAVPRRPMTPAKWRSVAKALLARHTCKKCEVVFEFCLPTSRGGLCEDCFAAEEAAALTDGEELAVAA